MVQSMQDATDFVHTAFADYTERATVDRNWIARLAEQYTPPEEYNGGNLVLMVTGSYPGSVQWCGPHPSRVPTPGKVKGDRFTVYRKWMLATRGVDWFSQRVTRNRQGAFVDLDTESLEQLVDEIMRSEERQICGDGTGILARKISNVSGSTLANWTFTVPVDEAPFFYKGQRLNFITITGMSAATTETAIDAAVKASLKTATFRDVPTSVGYYEVKNVEPFTDSSGNDSTTLARITIFQASPGGSAPANNDTVITADSLAEDASAAGTNAGREMQGLDIICDNDANPVVAEDDFGGASDSTFQNLSVANNGHWKSYTVNGGGTSRMEEPILRRASVLANAYSPSGIKPIERIFTSLDSQRIYEESVNVKQRIVISEGANPPGAVGGSQSSQQMDAEPDAPVFGRIKIHGHRFIRKGRAFGPDFRYIKRANLQSITFRPKHDDYSGRPADQQDAWGSKEWFTSKRNCHLRIEFLSES